MNSINPDTVDTELLRNFKDKLPLSAATPSTAPIVSWRASVPIHPAAGRIPDPTDEERRGLAADLERRGQQIPVVLVHVAGDPDARLQLLDGRTRLDLQEAAGVKVIDADGRLLVPHRVVEVQSDAEAEALSLSLNLHRRHLSGETRRKLIAAQIKADPEKSDRQIAGTLTVSPSTVGAVRTKMEAEGEVSKLDTRRDRRGRQQSAHRPRRAKSNLSPDQFRRDKLGDETVNKLKGTSLGSARELDELRMLNRGAPAGKLTKAVQQLVDDAVTGKKVSAFTTAALFESSEVPPDPFAIWTTFSLEQKRKIFDQEGRTGLVTIISAELLGDLIDHVIAQDLASASASTKGLPVTLTTMLRTALSSVSDTQVTELIAGMRRKLSSNSRSLHDIGVVLIGAKKRRGRK